MPLLVSALLGALIQAAGTLVGRVLISLGIAYVSYRGIDTMVGAAKDTLFSNIASQGSMVLQLAGVLQIGTCINILASAALTKLTIAGLTNGAVTRWVKKG